MSLNNLFVPYSLALLAKERGFLEDCVGYYLSASEPDPVIQEYANPNKDAPDWKNTISAPLYQQLCDWFREKHLITIHELRSGIMWYWCVSTKDIYCKEFCESQIKALKEAFKLI